MAYWSGLRASIKELKAMRAIPSDPRIIARLEAMIAAKQSLLDARDLTVQSRQRNITDKTPAKAVA